MTRTFPPSTYSLLSSPSFSISLNFYEMDDETSSMSAAESATEFVRDRAMEMVRIGGTELSLMGGDRSVVIRSGEFAVWMVRHPLSPLSAVVCLVGDHQWPIAKDSPVLRVGLRRFSFALPGFLYGLAFPESCLEDELKRLEEILMRFCAYQNHSRKHEYFTDFNCMAEIRTDFWSSASSKIEKLSNQMLAKIVGEEDQKLEFSVENFDDMNNKAQKAIRMSAISKLVSKALMTGTVNFNFHVNVVGPKDGEFRVFASIRAFADVVEAVETAGRSIMTRTYGNWMLSPEMKYWNFNRSGLALLLRAVAASAVTHVAAAGPAVDVSPRTEFGYLKSEDTEHSCLSRVA